MKKPRFTPQYTITDDDITDYYGVLVIDCPNCYIEFRVDDYPEDKVTCPSCLATLKVS